MPIIEKEGILFVHIPKTGGSSINEFFDLDRHRDRDSIYQEGISEHRLPGNVWFSERAGEPNMVFTQNDLRPHLSPGDYIRIGNYLYQIMNNGGESIGPDRLYLSALDQSGDIMNGELGKRPVAFQGDSSRSHPIFKKLITNALGNCAIPSKYLWGWITTTTKSSHHEASPRNLSQVFGNNYIIKNGKPALELDHVSIQYMRCRIPKPLWDTMCSFCYVRNPYARLVSEYFWKRKGGDVRFRLDCQQLSFGEFVVALYKRFPTIYQQPHCEVSHFLPQYDFVYNKEGECLVHVVGKLEDGLESTLRRVYKILGKPSPKPIRLKKSNTTHGDRHPFEYYYTPQLKDLVYEMYKIDFDTFHYDP